MSSRIPSWWWSCRIWPRHWSVSYKKAFHFVSFTVHTERISRCSMLFWDPGYFRKTWDMTSATACNKVCDLQDLCLSCGSKLRRSSFCGASEKVLSRWAGGADAPRWEAIRAFSFPPGLNKTMPRARTNPMIRLVWFAFVAACQPPSLYVRLVTASVFRFWWFVVCFVV